METHPIYHIELHDLPPALKNQRNLVVRNGKPYVVPNKKVKSFYKKYSGKLIEYTSSVISPSLITKYVLLYCRFGVYSPSHKPRKDIDNMVTTIQEMLQSDSKHGGVAGAYINDSQVRFIGADSFFVSNRLKQITHIFWTYTDSVLELSKEITRFLSHIYDLGIDFSSENDPYFQGTDLSELLFKEEN